MLPLVSVQTNYEAHTAFSTVGAEIPFCGGRVQPGHNADHTAPSSAKVRKV
jgi:hypothetical protein